MKQHSYRRKPKPPRPTRITIPEGVSPHVKLVFAEMKRQNVKYDVVEDRSGVLRTTIKAWRHKNAPGLTSIEAVLGSLGWYFVPVPRAEVLPEDMRADLAAVAERHGQSMTKTIEGLISIVTGIHDGAAPPLPPPCEPASEPSEPMAEPTAAA
ncbi:hypothetical protein IHEIED_00461 [Methylorubrum populi]